MDVEWLLTGLLWVIVRELTEFSQGHGQRALLRQKPS